MIKLKKKNAFNNLTLLLMDDFLLSIVFQADEFLGGRGGGAAGETAGDFVDLSTAA